MQKQKTMGKIIAMMFLMVSGFFISSEVAKAAQVCGFNAVPSNCADIWLDKTTYAPGEQITVNGSQKTYSNGCTYWLAVVINNSPWKYIFSDSCYSGETTHYSSVTGTAPTTPGSYSVTIPGPPTVAGKVSLSYTVAPLPTCSISWSPTSINVGGSSTITWSSTNATSRVASCTGPISSPPTGDNVVNGSLSVSFPLSAGSGTETCSMTVTGPGGSKFCSKSLVVNPAPCNLPWGGTIASGTSVTAYSTSSVACGSTCASQTRTCTNGVLSGTYANQSCSVQACPTLTATLSASPASGVVPFTTNLSTAVGGTATGTINYSSRSCGTSGLLSGASGGSFTCTYSSAGTYYPSIRVDRGSNWATASATATATASPTLNVALTATPATGTFPLTSNLTTALSGTATGTATYANQSCGTGTAPTVIGANGAFTCVYPSAGTYTASISVTRGGQSQTGTATITVTTPSYALTVTKDGPGGGRINSTASEINCGSTCTYSFPYNTVVTLSPTADTGSVFSSWTGACTGTGACSVTMSAARSVNANFTTCTYGTQACVTPTPTCAATDCGLKTGTATCTALNSCTNVRDNVTCTITCNAQTATCTCPTADRNWREVAP